MEENNIMEHLLLCDTCVIIDYINEHNLFLSELHQNRFVLFINSIIELELLQGAHDRRELQRIEQRLNIFRRLEMNQNIFDLATQLVRTYTLSHNLRLADALIAATTLIYDLPLFTYNTRDFEYLPNIQLWDPSTFQTDQEHDEESNH